MHELIYYIRKPESKVTVAYEENPEKGKGWYSIKLSRGDPYALLLSNGYNSVGWAVCSHGDSFNKKKGLMIARAREANGFNLDHVPEFMKEHLNIMLEKSRNDFGDK